MTAKEYLSQIRLLNLKIDQKMEEKADLMSRAAGNHSPTLTKDKVQSSISGDRMSNTIDRYVDLEKEIDDLIDRYVDKRDMIINQIHQLEDPRYVELLQLKYVGRRVVDYQSGQMLWEHDGDLLTAPVTGETAPGRGGKCLAKLSRSSRETIQALRNKGFEIYKSEIRFMVYWKGKNEENEVLCVLPDIYLKKDNS